MNEAAIVYLKTKQHWRKWLIKNHLQKNAVWLIFYKKSTGMPTINWSDAVDEALCFGWVDSKAVTIDNECYKQYFCKRKPVSTWSKINKEKVQRLINEGLMMKAGFESIETAKQNGSWQILDKVESLTIPKDLATAFKTQPGSSRYFKSLSKSVRKMLLQWIKLAKRPETRQKRIDAIVLHAAREERPQGF